MTWLVHFRPSVVSSERGLFYVTVQHIHENMASTSGGKRLSKKEKRKLQSERGKKSTEVRGLGFGARQDFVLPAQWNTEEHETASKKRTVLVSPGKTKYHHLTKVRETLRERSMDLCFLNSSESSQSEGDHSDFEPYDKKSKGKGCGKTENVERRLFVCESTQVTKFVEDINKTSRCSTLHCKGKGNVVF